MTENMTAAQIAEFVATYSDDPAQNDLDRDALSIARTALDALAEVERWKKHVRALATEEQCRCMFISRDTERAYETGTCIHQVARTALEGKQ